MSEPYPSAWIYWPTEDNPSSKYKYASIEFNRKLNTVNWTRETYSVLDWLGDLGGLLDILIKIGEYLVEPVAQFTV